tara:strand:- start:18159 stop:19148 length:990 start_codon:yes stop_codon:yes gene_type:complete
MSYQIDADGTVHLGDVRIPVPDSLSTEARAYLSTDPWAAAPMPDEPVPMWAMRDAMAPAFDALNAQAQAMYPVDIEEVSLGGVRCHRVRPAEADRRRPGALLINLHGGGFVVGSGALVEAIPVAVLTGFEVIAVDYRLAPEHPYPAAVEDVLAVYRACLAEHDGVQVGLYGSSAGGFLTAQAIARMQREGLPLPACAGVFSAGGNLAEFGDTRSIFTLSGFYGQLSLPLGHELSEVTAYLGGADARDPLVSPELGDLAAFPPTLLISGTRDALLSGTTNFHRALLRAGRTAELIVYDGMPHSHWYALDLPETRETLGFMSEFFARQLSG